MSDEEISKKRLINDGEVKIDDKRLKTLVTNIVPWTNSHLNTAEEKLSQAKMNQLSPQIATCQLEAHKDELVVSPIAEESVNYDELIRELDEQIANTKKEVATLYAELEKPNEESNAELIDKIMIKIMPSVEEEIKEIKGLEKELAECLEKSAALDKRRDAALQAASPCPNGEAVDIDENSEDNAGAAFKPVEN